MGPSAADILEAMVGCAHELVFEAKIDPRSDLVKDTGKTGVSKREIRAVVDSSQHIEIVEFGVDSAHAGAKIRTKARVERDLVFKRGQDWNLKERKGAEFFIGAYRLGAVGDQPRFNACGQGLAELVSASYVKPSAGVKLEFAGAERIA